MRSRWNEAEAKAFVDGHPQWDEDVALRLYSASLWSGDRRLSCHGRGCASLKTRRVNLLGDEQDVLRLLTTERDGDIDSGRIVTLRLSTLRRAVELDSLTDEAASRLVKSELIVGAPETTVAQLFVHAFLPARFVDFFEAEAVLRVAAQPDPEAATHDVLGEDVLFVRFRPGIALARDVALRWKEYTDRTGSEPAAVVIDDVGLLTWGETAEQSYERMLAQVTRAEDATAPTLEAVSAADQRTEDHDEARRGVALAVRGAMARASKSGWVAEWRTTAKLLRFSLRDDLERVCRIGAALPLHVAKTRALPLVLTDQAGGDAERQARVLDQLIASFRRTYAKHVRACQGTGNTPDLRDHLPRVVVVPDLGVLCLGRSNEEAIETGTLFEHVVNVLEGAESMGSYDPVAAQTLYDAEVAFDARGDRGAEEDGPLRGRVALVTGAASGIGLATSRALLAAGAHVVITDRDERVLEAVSAWPAKHYPDRSLAHVCNVTTEKDCRRVVDVTCDAYGGLDILVSNAGIAPSGLLHTESGDAALRASLDVNLLGHQRVARAATEAMIAQGSGGVLLFNASKSAFSQGPDFGPYAIAKAALVSLMRQYAVDLGRHGIRANAVNADRIRLSAVGLEDRREKSRDLSPTQYFRSNLLRREPTPAQVAEAFVYLATAGATTGCIITVDGGNPAAFPR